MKKLSALIATLFASARRVRASHPPPRPSRPSRQACCRSRRPGDRRSAKAAAAAEGRAEDDERQETTPRRSPPRRTDQESRRPRRRRPRTTAAAGRRPKAEAPEAAEAPLRPRAKDEPKKDAAEEVIRRPVTQRAGPAAPPFCICRPAVECSPPTLSRPNHDEDRRGPLRAASTPPSPRCCSSSRATRWSASS